MSLMTPTFDCGFGDEGALAMPEQDESSPRVPVVGAPWKFGLPCPGGSAREGPGGAPHWMRILWGFLEKGRKALETFPSMRPTSNALLPPWTPAAAISLLFGCGRDGAAPSAASDGLPRRPDVVLVSIDSLRPDHLGCYGYRQPTSPTIDRLAEEGVRCEVALSTTSWTLPAHAAMLTGLFDSAHG